MSLISTRLMNLFASVSLLLSVCANAIAGQPGTLDTSFGNGGSVVTAVGQGGSDYLRGMVVQPDGKIVLAGTCYSDPNTYDFCAVRYSANGTLDANFGNAGKVVTTIAAVKGNANAAALQTDGKIVLVGSCYNVNDLSEHFCAIRYNANGTLDSGFGTNGLVITPIGADTSVAKSVSVQPNGKIVVAGICAGSNNDFCALRYETSGTIDTTFGQGGKVVTAVGSLSDIVRNIALQPDGKIVLVGACQFGVKTNFCALRYQANGVLDTTFGTSGTVSTVVSAGTSDALGVAIQPDGKIILIGTCRNASSDFCALRYLASGTLDSSFNTTGIVTVGNFSSANALALQPDGKLLVAGQCENSSNFCALRFHPSGVLDTNFGSNGKAISSVGAIQGGATAVGLQADGKILLSGSCAPSVRFCASRYEGVEFSFQPCSLDVDGDGLFLATTDALIYARIALGITGSAVLTGINFRTSATRNSWPLIRDYLVNQCGLSLQP